MKRVILTELAPVPVAPYSQAIEKNGFLFISGQVPVNPETGKVVEGGIAEQTMQVLENVKAIVEAAGYTMDDMVKTTCLLSSISDFKAMNEVYARYFTGNQPARAAYAVKDLPLGVMIEIEGIAAR